MNATMTKEQIQELMLKDLLNAVNHFYGPDGLGKVVERMKLFNRARDHQAELDALEQMIESVHIK